MLSAGGTVLAIAGADGQVQTWTPIVADAEPIDFVFEDDVSTDMSANATPRREGDLRCTRTRPSARD